MHGLKLVKSLLLGHTGQFNIFGVKVHLESFSGHRILPSSFEPKNQIEKRIISAIERVIGNRVFQLTSNVRVHTFVRLIVKAAASKHIQKAIHTIEIHPNGIGFVDDRVPTKAEPVPTAPAAITPKVVAGSDVGQETGRTENAKPADPVESKDRNAEVSSQATLETAKTTASGSEKIEQQKAVAPTTEEAKIESASIFKRFVYHMTPSTTGMAFATMRLIASAALKNLSPPLAYVTIPLAAVNAVGALAGIVSEYVGAYSHLRTKNNDFHDIRTMGKGALALASVVLVAETVGGIFLAAKVANYI